MTLTSTVDKAQPGIKALPSRRYGAWTLQGIVAAVFFVAGEAKLAGVPFMVQLFDQIGLGQWLRLTTGSVEVIGALVLMVPGLAPLGGLWLGGTMMGAIVTHLLILHTNPAAAIVLGLANAGIVYLRREELADLIKSITG